MLRSIFASFLVLFFLACDAGPTHTNAYTADPDTPADSEGDGPVIHFIQGDGSDEGRIGSSLWIVGDNLQGASVELALNGTRHTLPITYLEERRIQVLLPEALESGLAALTVSRFGLSDERSIYLLRGEVGAQGDRGPAGEAGVAGPRGEKGEQGEAGEVGPQGPQGERGERGPAGLPGPVGPMGPAGLRGPQGEMGPRGAQGAQGPKGDQGPAGPAGAKGDTGNPGAQGPRGLQGLTGPRGADAFSQVDVLTLGSAGSVQRPTSGWASLGSKNVTVDKKTTLLLVADARGTFHSSPAWPSASVDFELRIGNKAAGTPVSLHFGADGQASRTILATETVQYGNHSVSIWVKCRTGCNNVEIDKDLQILALQLGD